MSDIFEQLNASPDEGLGQGEPLDVGAPAIDGQGEHIDDGAPEAGDGQGQGDETNTAAGWNAEFQSPEELYEAYQKTRQSYDNLRPKLTQTTQQLSEMLKQQRQSEAEALTGEQGNQYGYEQDGTTQIISKVRDILVPIQQQQAQLVMNQEVNRLSSEHKDFAEVAPDMMKVFDENPALWNTEKPLELAYQLAKANHVSKTVEKVAKDARAEAYKDREIKEIKNFSSGAGSLMDEGKASVEDDIRASILGDSKRGSNYFI